MKNQDIILSKVPLHLKNDLVGLTLAVKAALYYLNKTMVISQIYKTDMTNAVALNAFIGRLHHETPYGHLCSCFTTSHS